MTGLFFSPSVCPWDDVEKWTQGLSWTQGQLDERKIVGFIIIGEFLELSIIIRIRMIIIHNLISWWMYPELSTHLKYSFLIRAPRGVSWLKRCEAAVFVRQFIRLAVWVLNTSWPGRSKHKTSCDTRIHIHSHSFTPDLAEYLVFFVILNSVSGAHVQRTDAQKPLVLPNSAVPRSSSWRIPRLARLCVKTLEFTHQKGSHSVNHLLVQLLRTEKSERVSVWESYDNLTVKML